jgi:hypothetical protein
VDRQRKLCLIASGAVEAISSSLTLVTANMSKTSLRKPEITVLEACFDNGFFLFFAENATVNSSMVQNERAKPWSLASKYFIWKLLGRQGKSQKKLDALILCFDGFY